MYDLYDYARMIAMEHRMGAYVRALEAAVRPGSVVVDIGTGTGIFALVACRLGARRVYAIDTSELVAVGRELALENGCAERIVFLRDDARNVQLPERADVIVSDLRGTTPLYGHHLAVIANARDRFLKPGGVLIPARDRLMVAVFERPDFYERALGPTDGPLGITLDALRSRLRHTVLSDWLTPLRAADVVSSAEAWLTLDYSTVRSGATHAGRADLVVERESVGHGLCLWFEALLFEGQGYSTAPGQEYGRFVLPWPRPVALAPGDRVAVDLWAQSNGEPWGWNSSLSGLSGTTYFKQSSFLGGSGRPRAAAAALRAPEQVANEGHLE
ncbi:MAG: 50S ribosomal protein L11 methyltransferase [Myxococcota bacterium]|nr:50S ribosomal protein L11 methyltransferase [Myxococcota bacterium]